MTTELIKTAGGNSSHASLFSGHYSINRQQSPYDAILNLQNSMADEPNRRGSIGWIPAPTKAGLGIWSLVRGTSKSQVYRCDLSIHGYHIPKQRVLRKVSKKFLSNLDLIYSIGPSVLLVEGLLSAPYPSNTGTCKNLQLQYWTKNLSLDPRRTLRLTSVAPYPSMSRRLGTSANWLRLSSKQQPTHAPYPSKRVSPSIQGCASPRDSYFLAPYPSIGIVCQNPRH